jgi:hypothetical protein
MRPPASTHSTLSPARAQTVAACGARILPTIGTESRDRLHSNSVRLVAERAAEVRRKADKPASEAWTTRMLVSPWR